MFVDGWVNPCFPLLCWHLEGRRGSVTRRADSVRAWKAFPERRTRALGKEEGNRKAHGHVERDLVCGWNLPSRAGGHWNFLRFSLVGGRWLSLRARFPNRRHSSHFPGNFLYKRASSGPAPSMCPCCTCTNYPSDLEPCTIRAANHREDLYVWGYLFLLRATFHQG